MGFTLIIAEKPSVASNIAKTLKSTTKKDGYYEGNGYLVSYAFGHLYTLADTKDYNPGMVSWDMKDYPFIPEQFKYRAIDDSGVKKQIKTLKELVKQADTVINACDGDREGELIFAEIKNDLKINKPIKRLWITSHTPKDIEKGMQNLKNHMQNLESAGYCRQQLDWIMGINFSVAFTLLAGGEITLKVGRVVLPTLKLIFDREVEIANFQATPFYNIKCKFKAGQDEYTGVFIKDKNTRFISKDQLLEIQKAVLNQSGIITKRAEKETSVNASKLFNLTDLQGYITSKYDGFTSDSVLKVMQSLYEKKFLTYPRTASRYLDDSQIKDAEESLNAIMNIPELGIKDKAAAQFHPDKKVFDSSKVDSHPAIIPTYVVPNIQELPGAEKIVYLEVAKRFVAQFMPPAVYNNIELITQVGEHEFITRGRILISKGWKQLFSSQEEPEQKEGENQEDETEDNITASNLNVGVGVVTDTADMKEGITQAPNHYTEKTLLVAMENCGKKVVNEDDVLKGFTIGTPATRSDTIKKLISTGYVTMKGKYLLITELGAKVIYFFPVKRLLEVNFTGKIEKTLKDIENGEYDTAAFMKKMSSFTVSAVEDMKKAEIPVIRPYRNILGKCPDCLKYDVIENDKAYSCEGTKNKECKFTIWKDDKFLNVLGKKMTESIARDLVVKKESLIKGIKSKKGENSKYDAILSLTKNEESGYWNYALKFPEKKKGKIRIKNKIKFKYKDYNK